MEIMLRWIISAGLYVLGLFAVLWLLMLFVDKTAKIEVINPQPGVTCVVVSRLVNTGVSCWNDQGE